MKFTVLARIDDARLISACPHGVAHLTWERATLRLSFDELAALAALLTPGPGPAPGEDARRQLAVRPGDPGELQVGSAILRLPAAEFRQLGAAIREAWQRLEAMRASGEWEAEEPPGREDPLAGLRQHPFSSN